MPQLSLQERPHNNHYLFSDYYLEHRVSERQEWRQTDVRAAFERLSDLWRQRKTVLIHANEAQTEADWIRPVLRELGHYFTTQVSIQVQGGSKTPDYILCPDEATRAGIQARAGALSEADVAGALAVADAKAWERPLDRTLRAGGVRTLHEHPGLQIDTYIRFSGLPWGVLTNGRLWRLYHKDSSKKLDVFYEVDLPALLAAGDAEGFKYFWLFFRREAFVADSFAPGHPAWLHLVRAESESYERGVSESLKRQIYDALQALAQGFFDFPANRLDPDPATLKRIYDNSLIVLYRLLFILYAEDRDLLPVRSNEMYHATYSLQALKQRVGREMDAGHPVSATMSGLWQRLLELWSAIDRGDESLSIPAYNGGLFKPERHPFLEANRVGDRHLRRAIDLLARIEDKGSGHKEFVDYRDLEIRHLGSIYEGLLEYHVRVEERVVSLRNDKGERKATGSYYTPDTIVQYIVEHTVGPVLAETAAPHVDAEGGVQDAVGLEKAVLAINVLDPAMGSGHFLVAATDYIARFLVEHSLAADVAPDSPSDLAYWRRRVAQACIYGVDLNPLAVELAKLSLWLATVSKDKPLSFLDHHLRCGNSLIGARVADLPLQGPPPKKQSAHQRRKQQQAAEAGQLSMLDDSAFAGSMRTATGMMSLIEDLGSETLADVKQAESVYRDTVRTVTEKARLVADLWTARHFGLDIPDDVWQPLVSYLLHGGFALPGWEELIARGQAIARERRFLHWELEFPEVFFDKHGRLQGETAGFEVVIGNPPWGAKLNKHERSYYAGSYSVVSTKTKDTYQYFTIAALHQLRKSGRIGLIIPNTWLLINYAKEFRKHLLTYEVDTIIDHGDGVFGDATVESTTLILRNVSDDSDRCRAIRVRDRQVIFDHTADMSYWLEDEYYRIILEVNTKNAEILRKMRVVSEPFQKLCTITWGIKPYQVGYGDPPQTKEMMDNRIYHSDRSHGSDWKPLLVGTDVDRYSLSFPGNLFIKYGKWLMYPSNEALMTSPKILLRQTSAVLRASYDTQRFYCQNSVFIIHSNEINLLYLLVLLNSSAINFAYVMGNPQTGKVFPEIKPSVVHQLPIRRIAFTTPADERERLLGEAKILATGAVSTADFNPALTFVSAQLAADPERSDVVHDLLAHLAQQMIDLNKQRQKLERALDPFKWLDRGAAFASFTQVFADGIKYGELLVEPDLGTVRHDVEGLRLVPLAGNEYELQAFIKHRDPSTGWAKWQYDENGKIRRSWVPVYRFELHPVAARFYIHALPVLDQFNNARRFPGGKTRTTLQKLLAGRLPVCNPTIDLTPLEELSAELAAVRQQLARTDALIDQVVYRLYGLTEEEIAIVERRS